MGTSEFCNAMSFLVSVQSSLSSEELVTSVAW